jgi:ATP-dependent RNA helicase DDX35
MYWKPSSESSSTLPVYFIKKKILSLLQKFQVLIVIGETGSGKSTQIPKYLSEYGYKVVVSQPRRIACTSLSKRVSEEMKSEVGGLCGYKVQFEEKTSERTVITFMTDGMLFRQLLSDPLLDNYDVVMLDEIHEHSLFTDILLGFVYKIIQKRQSLRIIISSATIDAEKYLNFFNVNSGNISTIVPISGRVFPVDVYYLKSPCDDYLMAGIETVLRLHKNEPPGDILFFLTGREEIDFAVSQLNEVKFLYPIPLYASLSPSEQDRIFSTIKGYRRVIISTNIAEASVTIDNIVYVIDCGYVKVRTYSPHTRLSILHAVPISLSSMVQRIGRAGRVKPGKAYMLYPESELKNLLEGKSEIERADLMSVVLMLKSLGINNLKEFPWINQPSGGRVRMALQMLFALDILDRSGELSDIGKKISDIPVHPMMARTLFKAYEYGCLSEVSMACALALSENVFTQDESKRMFGVEEGDMY